MNDATHLPYLVGLRVSVIALQVELLGNAIPSEYMVASAHSLGKAQSTILVCGNSG